MSRTPESCEPERSRARNMVVRAAHRISRDSHDAERAGWGRARPKAGTLLRCIARLCAHLGARCIAPWSGSRTPESREPERSRALNRVVRAERASLSAGGCPARVTAFDPAFQTVEAAHHERTRRRPGGTLRNRACRREEVCLVRLRPQRHQPFCDGSHKVTDIRPIIFAAEESETAWLCGCKRTGSKPHCDGTHNTL